MSSEISLFDGAAWYMVFLFSTTVHEASHALAALKLGDDTAYRGGQVTLDPTPHIQREPFGMVVVPILSYLLGGWMVGWASAPYDPDWARRYPRRAGWMAMAGPASNFAQMLIAALLIRAGITFGFFHAPSHYSMSGVAIANREGLVYLAAVLLSCTFSLNLLLFVFNLIPLPPLDGSSGPLLLLSDSGAEKYWNLLRSPGMSMMGIFIAWQLFNVIFPPILRTAIHLLYAGIHAH